MSNLPSYYSPSNLRYSSRKPIFDGESSKKQNQENEELYRIIAKIRSLQDDVKLLIEENKQIQTDNIYLKKIITEQECSSTYEQDQILRLTRELSMKQIEANPIEKYEHELKNLSKKVDFLHSQINQKHKQFEKLKNQKDQLFVSQLKTKEEWNSFQFQENQLVLKIDQMLQLANRKENGSSEEKVIRIIEVCRELQQQIAKRNQELLTFKKKFETDYTIEREKRIQEEYNLQLLRQRSQDYEKKKDFFKSCYNQDRIELVIDDMLEKEHQLRQEINIQMEKNDLFKEQVEDTISSCDKRISRERSSILEELKVQRIKNELSANERNKLINELKQVDQSLAEIQYQGASITLENRVADCQNYKKISQLEGQNVRLESDYAQLLEQMNLLKNQQTI